MSEDKRKIIQILEKEIEVLDKKIEEVRNYEQFLYKEGLEDLRNGKASVQEYQLKEEIEHLKKQLDLYQRLADEDIYLGEDYYLTDNIYFSMSHMNGNLICYFYLNDDFWLYDNFISSHSGCNDWITEFINQQYSLLTGNSAYSYAWGTQSLKDLFKKIEDKEISNDMKIFLIKNSIEMITKPDGKFGKLRKALIDTIDGQFKIMKEFVEDEND